MSPDKKREYEDYIQTLYHEIERVKLVDTVPEEEIQKDIDSINKMIDDLNRIINEDQ